ncbi:MAG: fibrinogen-like YCDxxxxGGGW domain-containing protein, partial [Ferruginibacter sp.]
FTGSDIGFVTTWYDQSGQGRNLSRADENQQPIIINNGTFKYIGDKVAIDFYLNKVLVYDGALSIKSISTVIRSEYTQWQSYHAILDGLPRIGGLLADHTTLFYPDRFPLAIWRNGVSKNTSESLAPVDESMILSVSTYNDNLYRLFIGNYDGGNDGGAVLETEAIAFDELSTGSQRKTLSCNQGTYYTIALDCNTGIDVQPTTNSITACLGSTATPITVEAAGINLTYQWYSNTTAGNTGGAPVSGATSSTLVTPTDVAGTAYYYVEISSSNSPMVTSDVSGAVVVEEPVTLNVTPNNPVIHAGSSVLLTASGADSYVWGILNTTPLDNISNSKLAVGLRKLKTTYNGPAIRLRRDNDNAEANFGFSGNGLDLSAINTFLGTATGYCTMFYDQSGNGNDVAQTDAGQQPVLVLNGLGGKPVLHFDAGHNMYNSTNFPAPFSVIYAARQTGPSRGRVLASQYNNWLLGWWGGNGQQAYFEGWVSQGGGHPSDNNPYVYTGTSANGTSSFYENGNLISSNGGGVTGPNGISLNGNESSDADIAELFIFDAALSSINREKIENSTGSYYSIFGAPGIPGATFLASPAETTTYTVTGYSAGLGCSASLNTVVTVLKDPELGGFGPMVKTYFDRAFQIKGPASKSNAPFAFSSSNPAVASIIGDSVYIHTDAVTTINAVQESDGIYFGDSASTTLTINLVSVVTKNGGITTTQPVFVSKNGAINAATGLTVNGETKTTLTQKDGLTAGSAGISAQQIKADFPYSTDGVYWINLPVAGPTQIYCIMNSAVDGGGWMLMMKATAGNTFEYESTHWTSVSTLNASDNTRGDADAKYNTMNYFAAKDMLALWPDIPSDFNGSSTGGSINLSSTYNNWCWLQNDFNSGNTVVPVNFFATAERNFIGDANNFAGKGTAFSSQTDVRFYGFNFHNNPGNVKTRWGFGWNENGGGLFPNGNMDSDDVSGGIGMASSFGGYSAGDQIHCCENAVGINRAARVEVYIR